uniref:separase n=1 Tax=Neovison vison TaxID=452646 RepID=A0A8C7A3B9_NEOVI
MRSFKGINFGTLLSNPKEAEELLPDFKEFLSKLPTGSPGCRSDAERRQACDAILRACNQQLMAKLACPQHLGSLLELAELACNGYLVFTPQRSPLYLERILFIFLRNIATQGIPDATLRFAQPLHACLVQCSRQAAPQDYEAVALGSFSLLWKVAEALEERQAALSARLKALSFLVLLEDESTPCEVPHFASPTACRVVAAHQLFDATGHGLSEADADFLGDLLSRHVIKALVGEGACSPGALSPQRALCLLELTLEHCRRLCWSCHHTRATRVVEKAHDYLRNTSLTTSLQLCQLGVQLLQIGEGGSQALAKLLIKASALLNDSVEAPSPPLRALYDSCQFFLSGLERGIKRRYRPDAVLGLFAFLRGYFSLLRQLQDGVCGDASQQQQSLVQMHFQGLHLYTAVVYDFAQGCQVQADLAQLVESCKSTVVWMLEALQGLSGQELTDYLGMTASYTSNLAYSFYSHKLYAEACAISEPFCQHLGLAKPATYPKVPPEKLHRCFRLHGESLKKLGKQAQGCKMVSLWLTALQPCGSQHMAEPVTFWVRVKMDAAKAGDKELQLRTLRDSLSGWDPETLVFLLREELQAYKAVRANTGQERFNVICDLLELSPEETPVGAWARATHLVELAQVLCYHDFAQQTNCSALDAVQEALQLLESVRPEPQAKDQLLDDKAQALLWLYICTLEAKMQEGMERDRRAQAPNHLEEFEVNDLNYEDKLQEDRFLYSNIAFNLAADAAQSKCLDQALALWKEVLTKTQAPAVRCLQQTVTSLQTLAALYQLSAKVTRQGANVAQKPSSFPFFGLSKSVSNTYMRELGPGIDQEVLGSTSPSFVILVALSPEFGGPAQGLDSVKKFHLQKGKQRTRVHRPRELPEEEPFLRVPALELVATVPKEPGPIAPSTNSSPQLKMKPQPSPGFLTHLPTCDCMLCASPILSAVCLRWALVTAGVRLATGHEAQGLDLLQVVLEGCPAATDRLTRALQTSLNHKAHPSPAPRILDEILAQAYTQLALEGLSQPSNKSLGKVLESGLKFVAARVPYLEPWRASLLLIRALAKLAGLGSCTAQLFASSWGWQPPPVKPSPGSEPSKPRSQKHSGRGRQRATSSSTPSLHNTSLKGLEGGGLPCTPKPPGQVRPAGPRVPFTVFEEVLTTKPEAEVPKAPRVQQRVQTRLKVNFSDDSDLEDPVSVEARLAEESKRCSTASRGRGRARKGSGSKTVSVAAPDSGSRRPGFGGRSRRAKKVTSVHCEELGSEIMRTIPEEEMTDDEMEMSFEILRGSDEEDSTSGGKAPAPGPGTAIGECEVLRRDSSKEELPIPCPDKERDKDLGPRLRLPSAPASIGLSTLNSILDLLTTAFRGVSHCPPSGLYAHLCRFLALCLGQRDPYATACLVTESVSITCRHQLLTHLHRQLSKAQKHRGSLKIADQLQRLSLQERPGDVPLARIQHLFSFQAAGSAPFPELEKESFQERLALIPSGVTVCVLALATLQPGTVGDTLLLTRLEKGSPPVTVQIPTAQNKLPLSSALKEFDAIQKEQKENSSCTDKREWWTGRLELDHRMEVLITSLEKHVLGCWRGLLLPSSEDPGPAQEASRLQQLLQECGWKYPDPTLLKIVLSGTSTLTAQDIQTLAYGLCPARPEQAQELLSEAAAHLQGQIVPSNRHLVLVLDKDLQKLPWENMPSLRALPVTRLPSFRFLLSYSITKESGASSVLSQGVDPRNTFYVLNPHNNLSSTEEQFRAHFSSEAGWKGVVGEVPTPEQAQAALTEHDLYIYAGHGAGARFLDGQAVLRLSCRAVALLFGCSSAALAVHGRLEGAGIVLKYIMAGCPLFLGNLWDVTDRDIDRYTEALLQGWLGAGPGAPLLYYVNQARQAPRLKYLIGAAPVAYGLPVCLR